jgi:predicted Rossmann-fold nucleotide-binding protein
VLYGSAYWNEVIDFEALVRHGMIERQDLTLFRVADDPASALAQLQSGMTPMTETETPAIAHSRSL